MPLRWVPAVTIGRAVRTAARLRKPGGGSAVPGLVVNRIHPRFPGAAGDAVGTPLGDRLAQIAEEFEQVRLREERCLRRLESEVPSRRWVRIPYMNTDVASLGSLNDVAELIFAGSGHLARD